MSEENIKNVLLTGSIDGMFKQALNCAVEIIRRRIRCEYLS